MVTRRDRVVHLSSCVWLVCVRCLSRCSFVHRCFGLIINLQTYSRSSRRPAARRPAHVAPSRARRAVSSRARRADRTPPSARPSPVPGVFFASLYSTALRIHSTHSHTLTVHLSRACFAPKRGPHRTHREAHRDTQTPNPVPPRSIGHREGGPGAPLLGRRLRLSRAAR